VLAAPALAHSYKFGDIEVGHLWGPPTTETNATETDVFGPVMNSGAVADRLISVTSPLAKKVEFRTGKDETALRAPIDLPPSKPVSLASWGVHLRFIGLKHPLKEKEWVPIRLVFERAGAHDAKVLIETQPGH
jgi:copper(I)-binding protein